jgi:YggT family protein
MIPLLQFIEYVIRLYEFVVIANVIFSWLIAFNVVNAYNPVVRSIYQAVSALTDPVLKYIRRVVPGVGGLDLSPVILLLFCYFLRFVVIQGWLIDGVFAR